MAGLPLWQLHLPLIKEINSFLKNNCCNVVEKNRLSFCSKQKHSITIQSLTLKISSPNSIYKY